MADVPGKRSPAQRSNPAFKHFDLFGLWVVQW